MSAIDIDYADGHIATLTLDRPPASALDLASLVDLIAAVDEVASASPRAVVIAGKPPFFSGGADLKDPPVMREGVIATNEVALKLFSLSCPVVGAVTGHAVGSGLIVALCCDVRIASRSGRYGLTEVAYGFAYPQAAFDIVRATLSPRAAERISLGGDLLDADACLALGVFDEILPAQDVLPRAMEEAERRAALPAAAYARTKAALRAGALTQMRASAEDDPLLAGDR